MDINSFNINKTNNHSTPQLIAYNNKTAPYGIGNLNPYLGHRQKYGNVKPINEKRWY